MTTPAPKPELTPEERKQLSAAMAQAIVAALRDLRANAAANAVAAGSPAQLEP